MEIKEKLPSDTTLFLRHDEADMDRLKILMHGQSEVLEMISSGATLPAILESIVCWVELQSNERLFASILLMDTDGKTLRHGAAPSLPNAYNEAINGVSIGYNVGSCGTAAFTGETVIVEDIATDPRWKNYRDLALGFNLRACWSSPLISKRGKVLGTFAIYYDQPKKPSFDDLEIIKLISRTTVIAIEHNANSAHLNTALIQSEKRFRSIIEQAPVAMGVIKGTNLVVDMANEALLSIWGKTSAVIGKPLSHALPEIIDQPFPSLLQQVMAEGKTHYGYEALARLERHGRIEDCYFNFVYAPYFEEGIITGVQVVANEVTTQVVAKKALEESEKRFRNLVYDAPVATGIYIGENMNIALANDAMLKVWGKDSSVIGKQLHEGLPELEGQPFLELLRDVYSTGESYSAKDARADLVVDGTLRPFYFNFTYQPLRDANGAIYAILNMAVDVTDSVMARRKLAGAEERLRLATEATDLGTWDLDLTTSEVIYSRKLNEIFGWDNDRRLTQVEMRSQIHPDDIHQVVEKAFELALQTGTYEYEARVVRPDDSIKWIRTHGKIIYGDQMEPMRMVGTMMDITEQKKALIALEESEERYRSLATELESRVQERTLDLLRANESLEQSNAELAQYAYVASHDLQEPLRKIRVFSSMLMARKELGEDSTGLLSRVMSSADRMSQLINDLLEFSRLLNAGKAFQTVDLNEVLQNVMQDFELSIREKNAIIELGTLPTIEAVPLQMNQLFNNFFSNALKFSRENEPLEIHVQSRSWENTDRNKFGLKNNVKYFEMTFSDNGIGFNPRFAEQIFEVFKRLHSRQAYPGSGIGLALCRKIVENHHGLLFAESQEGQGTVFHIVLPASQQ